MVGGVGTMASSVTGAYNRSTEEVVLVKTATVVRKEIVVLRELLIE